MKLTADKFLELLNDKGVAYTVQGGQLLFTGDDIELIASLYELLEKNASFEAAIIQRIHVKHGISLKDYRLALESAGVKCELADLRSLKFTGGKAKTKERLIGILEDNGYSDSLLMAVLSGITATGETVKRDEAGQILLKLKTDWNAELSNLEAD